MNLVKAPPSVVLTTTNTGPKPLLLTAMRIRIAVFVMGQGP